MDPAHDFDTINKTAFTALLEQYPQVVPEKLAELETQRLETIPAALEKRRGDGEAVYLTKTELATLMKWKLSHGKFRPQLASLIDQNTASTVQSSTTAAFLQFSANNKNKTQKPDTHPDTATFTSTLKTLTTLRGVGPATASLLLSILAPAQAPFFSDELFRWAFYASEPVLGKSGTGAGAGAKTKGKEGWAREIKYSLNEYLALVERVHELRARLANEEGDGDEQGFSCLDVEMVAYVLGKQAQGGGGNGKGGVKGAEQKGKKRKGELGFEGVKKDGEELKTGSESAKKVKTAADEEVSAKTVKKAGGEEKRTEGLRRSARERK